MFDLEQAVADWRREMSAAGINNAQVLDELESHLREETQGQLRAGLNEPAAFSMAIRQIGQSDVLKAEFTKVGGTIYEKLRQLFFALAGIPDYQLATNMNSQNQNLEPGWATYLKTAAFIIPAIIFWIGSCVIIMPKLKEICAASGLALWEPILAALALSDFIRRNIIAVSAVILATLFLLEGRSHGWPRYRRLAFGILAFLLNSAVLIAITAMLVLAVAAGASLSHPLPHGR